MLTLQNVSVTYGARTVLSGVSLTLREGQWLMLSGPNGAGKSTLLRAVLQGARYRGDIRLMGRDIRSYAPAQRARLLGALAQQHGAGYAYTVEELVRLGRYAYRRGLLSAPDRDGEACVERALEMTGMQAFRRAPLPTLSGGELQRAFLAQALAQDPRILLLDEPANHLDLIYQRQIFSLIDRWRRQPGRAVISVVHDLSLARRYGTHALLLSDGSCVAQGEASAVFSPDNLRRVYGMDVYAWMRGLLSQWQTP